MGLQMQGHVRLSVAKTKHALFMNQASCWRGLRRVLAGSELFHGLVKSGFDGLCVGPLGNILRRAQGAMQQVFVRISHATQKLCNYS